MGILYLVATPIGNLEDISARALRILKEVQLIAAEDTRRTGKLLKHFGIDTKLTSYHEHNKLTKLEKVLDALSTADVALVSDAGTPVLNDPGYELVKEVLKAGHEVSPVPGPSAPLSALVVSGLPCDSFTYLGYLPRKKNDRKDLLEDNLNISHTLIFLETPQRLLRSLQDILDILGDRDIAVARELTKLHEEIYRSTVSGALEYFSVSEPRGEFTLVLAGSTISSGVWSVERVQTELEKQVKKGESASSTAREVAQKSGWTRRQVYELLLRTQENEDTGTWT